MLTINKSDVMNFALLEAKSEERKLRNQISFFENKYSSNYSDFLISIKSDSDFQKENDYIDWTATIEFLKQCQLKIADLESGNFNIA